MIFAAVAIAACMTNAPDDQCTDWGRFDDQVWESPTMEEFQECADIAERLRGQGKRALCELLPNYQF